MRANKILLSFIIGCLLLSCNGNTVYKKFSNDFSDNRWMKKDVLTYKFSIEEAGSYDILVDYSHVYNTPLAGVPVRIAVERTGEILWDESVPIVLRDEDGNQIGDCSGDYCDLRQAVLSGKELQAGEYKVRLTNEFDFEYLPNILGIGIRVAKAEKVQ